MTGVTQFHTFSTNGLNETEVKFLAEVEKMFFEGAKESFDNMMLPAFKRCGFEKGSPEAKDCLEAWEYWNFLPHPYDRQSYKKPRELNEIFTSLTSEPIPNLEYSDKRPKSFWISCPDFTKLYGEANMDYLNSIDDISLIYDFTPQHYYFQIVNDCLYLKAQQIISSRFIAVINHTYHEK